ncbi:MAG: VanZ family protein [Thermoanaerobaculum sp.]
MTARQRYLAVASFLAAAYLWVGTRPRLPQPLRQTPDWAGHGLAYALFSGVLSRGLSYPPAAAGVATAHGALLEWLQRSVPGRSAELSDLVSDGLGAAAGVWLMRRKW